MQPRQCQRTAFAAVCALAFGAAALAAGNPQAWPTGDRSASPASSAGSTPATGTARAPAAPDVNAPPPFVVTVEQVIPLPPSEWDVLSLRQLESRLVNAPDDAAREATAQELEVVRRRMTVDRSAVLLGSIASGTKSAQATAVFVPSSLGGAGLAQGSTIRVIPSSAPFPASSLGEAERAYPILRRFGTAERPAFVATALEPVTTERAPPPPSTLASGRPSPWARQAALSVAESADLVVDSAPDPGSKINGMVPMFVTVRNAGKTALPACEVFFEFTDGSGNLIHREFRWVTRQRSMALEAQLPALGAGESANVEVPVPPEIAPQIKGCKVLILRTRGS